MEGMFLSLLELSIGTSLMILLMLLLIPLAGKKFSTKWRYWLWLLLAARLLCPFSLELDIPAMKMELPQELAEVQQIAIDVPELPIVSGTENPEEVSHPAEEESIVSSTAHEKNEEFVWHLTTLELLGYLWLVGAVGSGSWQLAVYCRYRRCSKLWNKACQDERAYAAYEVLCESMNIKNPPILLTNRKNKSPMLIGFLKPKLLLPEIEYSEEDYRVMFSHELHHYKRHDLWYKLLILTARCVHWFNPLVYVMMREAENDLEITCDEAVVRNFNNEDRAFYCETILRILCKGKERYTLLSTGFNSGKKVLQRRFEAVLNEKSRKGLVLGAVSIVLMIVLCGFVRVDVAQPMQQENESNISGRYLAIPEEQRALQHTELIMAEPILPVQQNIEFWEKKALKFFSTDFEMKNHMSPNKLGDFFDVLVSDFQLYDAGLGHDGAQVFPKDEIITVLYSHLPAQAIQPEGNIDLYTDLPCHDIICPALSPQVNPHCLDLVQIFNESGYELFPYNELTDIYTFEAKKLLNKYDTKVMETLSAEVQEVEAGVKRFTFKLVSYDKDKYYAEPQEKELLEGYRFSVRVAEDSWFIEEATLTNGNQ